MTFIKGDVIFGRLKEFFDNATGEQINTLL